jgi:hypothetical protein
MSIFTFSFLLIVDGVEIGFGPDVADIASAAVSLTPLPDGEIVKKLHPIDAFNIP